MILRAVLIISMSIMAVPLLHAEEAGQQYLTNPAGRSYSTHVKRTPEEQKAFDNGCGNQQDLTYCTAYNYRVLDAQLNTLYAMLQLQTKGDAAAAKRLIKAQQRWLEYVEADCLFQNGPKKNAGSGWDADQTDCISQHIKTRIRRLEIFIQ